MFRSSSGARSPRIPFAVAAGLGIGVDAVRSLAVMLEQTGDIVEALVLAMVMTVMTVLARDAFGPWLFARYREVNPGSSLTGWRTSALLGVIFTIIAAAPSIVAGDPMAAPVAAGLVVVDVLTAHLEFPAQLQLLQYRTAARLLRAFERAMTWLSEHHTTAPSGGDPRRPLALVDLPESSTAPAGTQLGFSPVRWDQEPPDPGWLLPCLDPRGPLVALLLRPATSYLVAAPPP